MIRSFRRLALLLPVPLLVGCGSVLGYEDDYDVRADGSGGATQGGGASGGSAGKAGSAIGGNGGASSGGKGGSSTGGSAGAPGGGNAGTTSGGSAGASGGGNAGTTSGGNAGTTSGGNGGAGSSGGGNAGTSSGAAGGGQGGASGTTAGGSSGSGGGGPVNPTDCSVIYVSPLGSLSNDGCSPGTPVPSPLSGLLTAAKGRATELRICEGAYVGSITLGSPISLKGSYDCLTWTRGPLSAARPLSKILSATPSSALLVSGSVITRQTIIEGLHLQGDEGDTKSKGLTIGAGASPTVRFNLIEGRAAKGIAGPTISVGLTVEANAGPRVEDNVITSGSGDTTSATVASAGVFIDSLVGPLELVRNTITSGDAVLHGKGYGTFGIYVQPLVNQALTGENALRDNVVKSGHGRDESNVVEILSGAIFFDETSTPKGTIEIVGGSLVAGRADHLGTPAATSYPTAAGIFSGGHVSLLVDHVRIYGGDAPVSQGTSMALSLSGNGTTTILTSALHGGGVLDNTPYPRALESRSSGTLTISASTLFSGVAHAVGGGQAGGTGLYLSNPGRVVLRNNFFALHSDFTIALQLSGACTAPVASSLIGNAFASVYAGHSLFEGEKTGTGGCTATDQALPGLNARFPTASGNIRISPAPKHASELDLGCAPGADCLAKLFTSYISEAATRDDVIALTSASFSPQRCSLAKPPGAAGTTLTDLLGKKVPDTSPTVGALQIAAGICP